jgi:4'-phosphopantetheinyl transferase
MQPEESFRGHFMPLSIEIQLLDASFPLRGADDMSLQLDTFLDDLFKSTPCFSAREYISMLQEDAPLSACLDVRSQLCMEITKYIQINDRYLALASALLKSQAFFYALRRPNRDPFILVSLPRTKYRKPYIPIRSSTNSDDQEDGSEIDAFSISISHQWPFAGIVRIDHRHDLLQNVGIKKQTNKQQCYVVGFDIVVFDDVNPRLYDTVDQFVEVFRDKFAQSEWKIIQSCRDKPNGQFLREFYLQWAVKEAYTKAIGVGLGFDFSGFEVQWDEPVDCLWDVVSSSTVDLSKGKHRESRRELSGVVVSSGGNTILTSEQRWVFAFLPLRAKTACDRESSGQVLGAGCACVGPFSGMPDNTECVNIEWNAKWIELASMTSS